MTVVDVIGQIVVVSHIEAVSVNGKDTQKITVELCNHEYNIRSFSVLLTSISN